MLKLLKLRKKKDEEISKEDRARAAKELAATLSALGAVATVVDAGATEEDIEKAFEEHRQKVAEWELENLKAAGVDKKDLN